MERQTFPWMESLGRPDLCFPLVCLPLNLHSHWTLTDGRDPLTSGARERKSCQSSERERERERKRERVGGPGARSQRPGQELVRKKQRHCTGPIWLHHTDARKRAPGPHTQHSSAAFTPASCSPQSYRLILGCLNLYGGILCLMLSRLTKPDC